MYSNVPPAEAITMKQRLDNSFNEFIQLARDDILSETHLASTMRGRLLELPTLVKNKHMMMCMLDDCFKGNDFEFTADMDIRFYTEGNLNNFLGRMLNTFGISMFACLDAYNERGGEKHELVELLLSFAKSQATPTVCDKCGRFFDSKLV
jgi:hypothetical protein